MFEVITARNFAGGWRSPDGSIFAVGGLVPGGPNLNTVFNTKTSIYQDMFVLIQLFLICLVD